MTQTEMELRYEAAKWKALARKQERRAKASFAKAQKYDAIMRVIRNGGSDE